MEENIQNMVDKDIDFIEEEWHNFSHDSEHMANLFHTLFHRYKNEIEGFGKGLCVAQPFDDIVSKGDIYRKNIQLLRERLIGFRENGYSNVGLMDYYFEKEHEDVCLGTDFTQVRMAIGMMKGISAIEREEIMTKLDEMEVLCAQPVFKREKWEKLRSYLVWLSGKDVGIAMKILPLFLKIS